MAETYKPTVYTTAYQGPSQEKIDEAHKVLAEEKAAKLLQQKMTILACGKCESPSLVTDWTKLDVYETSYGPYERSEYLHHHELLCPVCATPHTLPWAVRDLEQLMQFMQKKEKRNDD